MSWRDGIHLVRLRRNVRLSIRALARRRWRTLLAASSLSIGIAAVVLLAGAGGGAERAFAEALEEMGKNLLAVSPERGESGALRGAGRQVETLTLDDWRALSSQVDGALRAAPIAMRQLEVRHGKRTLSTTVFGTTPEFQLTNNQRLAAGRFLDRDDVDLVAFAPLRGNQARVAVIGSHVVRELFAGEQPLGERLQVAGTPFVVIGILEEKGTDPTGAEQDNRILIPIRAAQRRLMNVDYLDRIFVQAVSKEALSPVAERIRALLRARHDLDEASTDTASSDDFTVRTQAALLETLEQADRSFSVLVGGLAALTLGLASIGLLAVSLLSVKERQGEIGLRLAVGARPLHVLLQFLTETAMVAVLGAAFGLLAGGCGIIVGERLLGWRLALTWQAAAYPFLLSLGIALVFGAYPALRAARLDPIVALRSQ